MKHVFGYVRVSTPRQGERGVSLQEQRDAITRYCASHNLKLVRWFEERETAAKSGRGQFDEMIKRLRKGAVLGVVIHKIDRSARNLRDWASLGDLIDSGVEVHFANESLDLNSRGGRLSADIQAVVAADYIRNLREEVKKGFYGRLKQGYYPRPAPLGYQDNGAGRPKTPHPINGPLMRRAFELYASGRYSLYRLQDTLHKEGLRNRHGRPITRNGLAKALKNPFYVGVIRIMKSGDTYPGLHSPLISKAVFETVQDILTGKAAARSTFNDFLYRRMLTCATCGRGLVGERQKGRIYYRCHVRACPGACVREDAVESAIEGNLKILTFSREERKGIYAEITSMKQEEDKRAQSAARELRLQLDAVNKRLQRLADLLLNGVIEEEFLMERKEALLTERVEIQERLNTIEHGDTDFVTMLTQLLEQADLAWLSYRLGTHEKKRELLETVSSNRKVRARFVCVELKPVFQLIANRQSFHDGGAHRSAIRAFLATLSQKVLTSSSAELGWRLDRDLYKTFCDTSMPNTSDRRIC